MTKNTYKYFKDNGTEFNPNLTPKPSLCTTCKKDDNLKYEIPCNLTRADQNEDIFICFAYESIGGQGNTEAILKEMEQYLDHKYGKRHKSIEKHRSI